MSLSMRYTKHMHTCVLAGGCFWGVEELFRALPGVTDTIVGYSGGTNTNPTYEFHPGHAEAIKITYDPALTSYETLLDFFSGFMTQQPKIDRAMIRVRVIVRRYFMRQMSKNTWPRR